MDKELVDSLRFLIGGGTENPWIPDEVIAGHLSRVCRWLRDQGVELDDEETRYANWEPA